MSDRLLDADVVVLGGGPTGLCAALELERHGVDTVVVERRQRTSTVYPTANHLTARTMELFRIWRIADRVRHSGFPLDHPDGRFFLPDVDAEPIYAVEMEPNSAPPDAADRCAERGAWCPRPFLDPVLIDAISHADHVRLLDGHEIAEVADTGDHVAVTVTNSDGDERRVTARWAVVAEGASSATRQRLGIEMTGVRLDGPTVDSLLFDAPGLSDRLRGRGTQFWFLAPREATIVSIDGRDRFRAHVPMHQLAGATIEEFLAEMVGPIEPVARFPWSPGLALADRYRAGNVFLAGDAAHIVTPYGGLGMNTGIEDAANLGAKLAAVTAGWADASLLDDYEPERRPVAEELLRYQGLHLDGDGGFTLDDPLPLALPKLPADLADGDDATRAEAAHILGTQRQLEFTKPGLELGIEYPIDGRPPARRGPEQWATYDPTVTAGRRAPHAVGGDGTALVDELRTGDVLVVGGAGAIEPVAERCAAAGIPTNAMTTTDPLYEGWTVIRPDGFVIAHRADGHLTDADVATLFVRLRLRSDR